MDVDHQQTIACATILFAGAYLQTYAKSKKRRKRDMWVKPWIQRRVEKGVYYNILSELRVDDAESYRRYLRMNTETFETLLSMVGPKITKQTTRLRKPIPPEEKLAVTLRFLATGESFESLMFSFRIHESTISKFIPEVCFAIFSELKTTYLRLPETREEWTDISEGIKQRWQFPNCIGAADGKHVVIGKPVGSGSEYYCYKGFFSIVLLAFVDDDYKFVFADVGRNGALSDGGVYRNCDIYSKLQDGSLNLPDPQPLPQSSEPEWIHEQSDENIPFFFVGDEAFPLGQHCMKPYSQKQLDLRKRIFNYRLSRMRRCSENAFGIWVNRFRIFATRMLLTPGKASIIVLCSLCLHNMLRDLSSSSYTPDGYVDTEKENGTIQLGTWRDNDNLVDFVVHSKPNYVGHNKPPKSAQKIRDTLADHFFGPGALPWQWDMV